MAPFSACRAATRSVSRRPSCTRAGARKRELIAARFEKREGATLGFALGEHDRSRPLVIDPVLVFASYLGGNALDIAQAVALDGAGSVYLAGWTASTDFPTVSPFQGTKAGTITVDGFITKLSPSRTLVYSTYLGGSRGDFLWNIAVDASGSPVVVGDSESSDFPVSSALQPIKNMFEDVVVAKLNPSGSGLVFSTFLGGSSVDSAFGLAVDGVGNIHVAGATFSSDFPTVAPLQASNRGDWDVFVSKLNPAGSALIYSTYLGGESFDFGQDLALTSSGVVVVGRTESDSFPVVAPLQATRRGLLDGFVSKLNSGGSALMFSTYLGGSSEDSAVAVATDSSGAVYVSGSTISTDFPTLAAVQPSPGGASDTFVSKLNAGGSAFVYSTYLGGNDTDADVYPWTDIAVDGTGRAQVGGYTASSNFPLASPLQSVRRGTHDAFFTRFSPSGTTLEHSTYLGGGALDAAYGVAVRPSGNAVVVGYTYSTDFPLQSPVQATNRGPPDAFVLEIGDTAAVPAGGLRVATALALLLLGCALLLRPARSRA